ncbi:hypothetical protein [Nocardia otitidiscaviarum]|uniref:hypothetical protein n=1 Tax=Nocardia otitidiscaviarum TaxID=1823 RepID=UPI001895D4CD|nr:hypothetical protein [Nocardia otitidiscaviarum]MBF6179904.1 hypothetical protein [Nocardia otitidiscaviarum]
MPFIDFGVATDPITVEYHPGARVDFSGMPVVDQRPQVWLRFGPEGPRVWLFTEDAEALVHDLAAALVQHARELKAGTSFDPQEVRS